MFIVMGVTWVLELVTWRITKAYDDKDWYPYVVLFLDLVNILQGVLIFIMMICRKKVWDLFQAKYLNSKCAPQFEDGMDDTII